MLRQSHPTSPVQRIHANNTAHPCYKIHIGGGTNSTEDLVLISQFENTDRPIGLEGTDTETMVWETPGQIAVEEWWNWSFILLHRKTVLFQWNDMPNWTS